MTKRQKSKLPVTSDIVFDESDSFSSDEDDNLQSFRTAMKKRRISNKRESESEARSSLSEEESESENSDSDHNDDLAKGKLDKLKETLNQVPVQEKNDSSSDDNGESEVESSEEEIESEKASSASDEDEENDKAKKQEKPSVEKEVDANERQSIREELRKMSLEEIQALKERLGLKLYNQALGIGKKGKQSGDSKSLSKKPDFKRENKNRPREISAKRQVTRFRNVVGVGGSANNDSFAKRDPRFDSMCGEFNQRLFNDNYKFVGALKVKEREKLQEALKTEEDPEEIAKIKYLIQRYDNQEREKKKLACRNSIKDDVKKRNKELAKEGKMPVYMSKAEMKDQELVLQYEELKKKGSLDKYLKKKEKRNSTKERRKIEVS